MNKNQGQRKKILVAAAKRFRKKTFLNTTIEDIAKSLNINKATIYYYFKSKTELLYEIMSGALNDFFEQMPLIVSRNASPPERMKALLRLHIKFEATPTSLGGVSHFEMKNLPPKLLRLYVEQRDKYENLFTETLRDGMAKGYFRNCDPKMATRIILGLVNSVTIWFKKEGALSVDEVAEEVWEFIAFSLRSNP